MSNDANLREVSRSAANIPRHGYISFVATQGCILILEDNADRVAAMKAWLDDRLSIYDHFISDDPTAILHMIRARGDDVLALSLDHDLFEAADSNRDGMEVVEILVDLPPIFPIILHSSNTLAVHQMERRLKQSQWTVRRVVPFLDTEWIGDEWYPTLRKLIRKQSPRAQQQT